VASRLALTAVGEALRAFFELVLALGGLPQDLRAKGPLGRWRWRGGRAAGWGRGGRPARCCRAVGNNALRNGCSPGDLVGLQRLAGGKKGHEVPAAALERLVHLVAVAGDEQVVEEVLVVTAEDGRLQGGESQEALAGTSGSEAALSRGLCGTSLTLLGIAVTWDISAAAAAAAAAQRTKLA
jgi:hypothetical protein